LAYTGNLVVDFAAEQLPDGLVVVLAGDVPQRDVEGRRDGVDELAGAPRERVASESTIDLFAVQRVLADEVVFVRFCSGLECAGQPLAAERFPDTGDAPRRSSPERRTSCASRRRRRTSSTSVTSIQIVDAPVY